MSAAIHYGGYLRYHHNGRLLIHAAGYPSCCSGTRAIDIADAGRLTRNPSDATCRRCGEILRRATHENRDELPANLRDPMRVLERGQQIERCGGLAPCPPIYLKREGHYAVVLVEIRGEWIEVIREEASGEFSHIWEGDIYAAIERHRTAHEKEPPRPLTDRERAALDRSWSKSVEVVDELPDETKDSPLGAETRAATSRGAHSTEDAGRPQPAQKTEGAR